MEGINVELAAAYLFVRIDPNLLGGSREKTPLRYASRRHPHRNKTARHWRA